MSQVKKDFNIVDQEAPAANSGTNFFDNPQVQPPNSIEMTPGEKAVNQTSQERVQNTMPNYPKGGGYYGK